jgi:hypothetical protein
MARLATRLPVLAVLFVAATATAARAADPKVEVGASLFNATIGLNDNGVSTVGIPASGVGVLSPGVYAALFVGPRISVEPQLGYVWVSSGGSSLHIVNVAAQVDYFLRSAATNAAYVFGTTGVLDVAGSATLPKSAGGGIGLRMLYGDRLTFRVDSRFVHFSEGGGNVIALTLSSGGVLIGVR